MPYRVEIGPDRSYVKIEAHITDFTEGQTLAALISKYTLPATITYSGPERTAITIFESPKERS